MDFNFLSTPKIVCQSGGLSQLGTLMQGLGATRVLVISDPGIVACGFAGEALDALDSAGLAAEAFDKVEADPPVAVVGLAIEAARAFRADGIVGLGGGQLARYRQGRGSRRSQRATGGRDDRRRLCDGQTPAADPGADHGGHRVGGHMGLGPNLGHP